MGIKNELRNLFQYSRDAVLCVRNDCVQFANSAAAELFRSDITGHFASRYVPDYLLEGSPDSFVSFANIFGRQCTVSAAHLQDVLVLTFYPEPIERRKTEFLSDGVLSSLNVAMCNIAVAAGALKNLANKDEECLRSVSSIYHAYYMLRYLIGNVGTAIALDEGTAACLRHSVDLAKLCSELVSTAALTIGDRASLSFSTDCGELMANVSSELIERLILNLISNSAMHTPPDGKIILGLKAVSGKAVISVDDNGTGIPPHILKRVFNAYELAITPDTLSDVSGGGLGLGICRGIAEIHGGSIIIESREGVGTSVRVLLPLGGESFAEGSVLPVPSMDNILTWLAVNLNHSDYEQLAE